MGNRHSQANTSSLPAASTRKAPAPLNREGGIAGAAALVEEDYSTAYHEIIPGKLFLGDLSACGDPDNLLAAGITHNVNALGASMMKYRDGLPKAPVPRAILYFTLDISDSKTENIGRFFRPVIRWIEDVLAASADHRVLVNCVAGVSRSATLVTAYVMQSQRLRARDALLHVQRRRTIICPNPGFMATLQQWEAHLFDGAAWPYDSDENEAAKGAGGGGGMASTTTATLLSLLRDTPVDYSQVARRLGRDVHIDGPTRATVLGTGSAAVVVTTSAAAVTAPSDLPPAPDANASLSSPQLAAASSSSATKPDSE